LTAREKAVNGDGLGGENVVMTYCAMVIAWDPISTEQALSIRPLERNLKRELPSLLLGIGMLYIASGRCSSLRFNISHGDYE
jgi:hypothetical protein